MSKTQHKKECGAAQRPALLCFCTFPVCYFFASLSSFLTALAAVAVCVCAICATSAPRHPDNCATSYTPKSTRKAQNSPETHKRNAKKCAAQSTKHNRTRANCSMKNERSNTTVTVAGSRNVTECPKLAQRLAELRPAEVVSGGARGADTLAAQWARANGTPLTEYLPDYAKYGAGATHVRNAEMAKAADVVLLLWDGKSRGTLSTWRAAKALGRHVEWLMAPEPNH